MNRKLKGRIIECFGSQHQFARYIDEHEAVVSKVVRNKRELDARQRERWAAALGVDDPNRLFAQQG